jgi:peptidoglycan/LPS O-acetylase OafA/YrhL
MIPVRNGQVDGIQYLRALAALLVVTGHLQGAARRLFDTPPLLVFPTGAGVDLFFVISGFVMMYTSSRLFQKPGATLTFIRKRLSRIVPLYWLVTTLFVLLLLMGKNFPASVTGVLASYLFIPYDTLDLHNTFAFPVYNLGWTLNYEMFFYVIFALFLPGRPNVATVGVCSALILLTVLGAIFQPSNIALHFWTQPILLEFCLGMLIARIYQAGVVLPGSLRLVLGILAFAIVWLDLGKDWMVPIDGTQPNNFARVLTWGLPMAVLLASVALGRGNAAPRPLTWLKKLGDSSYSLYLFHPFAIIFLEKTWVKIGVLAALGGYVFLALAFVMAVVISLLSHRYFERTTGNMLNRLGSSDVSKPVRTTV